MASWSTRSSGQVVEGRDATGRHGTARGRVDAANDAAGFVYTDGTTGLSKGAMLTHRNLVANAMQSDAWFLDTKDGHGAIMCVLPFFHCYGMTVGMNLGVLKAAKLVLVPRFDLKAIMKEIKEERPTLFLGCPRSTR